jgi:hypothetical protein
LDELMPAFLENKLKREYPNNPGAVYGTLNAIGAMRGSKETPKGRAMQARHDRDAQNGDAADTANVTTARRARRGFRLPGGIKPTLSQITGVKMRR